MMRRKKMVRNEESQPARATGKKSCYVSAILVVLVSLSPPTLALARPPSSMGTGVLARRGGAASYQACHATTGTIDNVETRLKVPAHAETGVVSVTIRSDTKDEVTVTAGTLSEVVAGYGEIQIGRKVAVHCSAPSLEFLS